MDRLKDVFSGGALFVVAVAYGAGALRLPEQAGEPGPGFVPLVLAVLLGLLALGIALGGLRRTAVAPPPAEVRRGAGAAGPAKAATATVALAALLQPAGFVLATLAYTAYVTALFTTDRRTRWVVPVGVVAVLFLFFRVALGVRLPPGPFG